MRLKIMRLFWLGCWLVFAAAPPTMAGAEPVAPVARQEAPAGEVVGNGTGASCDEAALHNALAGGGDITFNCGGPATILLLNPQTIAAATSIDGGDLISLTGGLTTRLFDVADGVPVTLRSIVLDSAYSGASDGGAISSGGMLTLDHVTIQHSQTDINHSGGALFTTGPVSMTDSYFYSNSGGNAGAIFALGASAVLHAARSEFSGNHALNGAVVGGGKGGALWVGAGAAASLTGSSWISNAAEGNGGAIYNEGRLTLDNAEISLNQTTLDDNAAGRGYGGGIASIGPLTVTRSLLYNNKSRLGGGLFVGDGPVPLTAQIDASYVQFNQATESGGGLEVDGQSVMLLINASAITNNSASVGGGLTRTTAGLIISRSSIGGNTANTAAGLYSTAGSNSGPYVLVLDSTIYNNVVTVTVGSGIFNTALMSLSNVTLEGNSSGVYNSAGAVMMLTNTVLHNILYNCTGTLPTSQGGNFASETDCALGGPHDTQGEHLDPQLGPLMSNADETAYFFLPLAGSPLVNTALDPCSAHDQRGA
ncbi:MAG: hypothetical protein ABI847_11920, partial [Anaerolineales bacterium]